MEQDNVQLAIYRGFLRTSWRKTAQSIRVGYASDFSAKIPVRIERSMKI